MKSKHVVELETPDGGIDVNAEEIRKMATELVAMRIATLVLEDMEATLFAEAKAKVGPTTKGALARFAADKTVLHKVNQIVENRLLTHVVEDDAISAWAKETATKLLTAALEQAAATMTSALAARLIAAVKP